MIVMCTYLNPWPAPQQTITLSHPWSEQSSTIKWRSGVIVYKQVFVYIIGPTACKSTNVTVLDQNSRYNVLAVSILCKQLEKQGEITCVFFSNLTKGRLKSVENARGTNEIGEHKGKYYHTAQFVWTKTNHRPHFTLAITLI